MAKLVINDSGNGSLSGGVTLNTIKTVYTDSVLLFKGKEKITIDFSSIETFDSAIISLMLSWLRNAKRFSQQIFFKNIPEKLHYLIEAYKLGETIRSGL